jgi:GDP-4-dehydro-6-deoxy-D-mannose reductase
VKAAVTGANGFVGSWLVRHLHQAGVDPWELNGPHGGAYGPGRISLDLRDQTAVRLALARAAPDVVFHLAAISDSASAVRDPHHALAVTVGGTLHLLAGAATLTPKPIVVLASSAEIYGGTGGSRPFRETSPIRANSIYGAIKAAQELMAQTFAAHSGLRLVVVRSFNLIGPGQRPAFAVASFADQLARIKLGLAEPVLSVGNLNTSRDFTDVRDAVRAFYLLAQRGRPGVFNLASGEAHALRLILENLIALSEIEVHVMPASDRLRAGDPATVIGDATLLRDATGWRPTISLRDSIRDVWEDALLRNRGGTDD